MTALLLFAWVVVVSVSVLLYYYHFRGQHAVLVAAAEAEKLTPDVSVPRGAQKRLADGVWRKNLEMALSEILRVLQARSDPAFVAAAAAVGSLTGVQREELGEHTRRAAMQALSTGNPSSVLLRQGTTVIYAVVFPTRCHQPASLRRHAAWKLGWSEHARRLSATIEGSSPGAEILVFLIFLRPGATEEALVFAYMARGGQLEVAPGPLLDELERRALRRPAYPDIHDFALRVE